MAKAKFKRGLLSSLLFLPGLLSAQSNSLPTPAGDLRLRIVPPQSANHHSTPAVVWLEPPAGGPALNFLPHGHYTLLQKNRTFLPHLQVVPVGTSVQFPNSDPFFHNVFSLFDGKRFDLGLYEAGTTRSVNFPREGVSYIFCNIHPEMSAVVIALSTPLYAISDVNESLHLPNIPPGDYKLHIWIEGVPQSVTETLTHTIHVPPGHIDLGAVVIPATPVGTDAHTNKFGNAYESTTKQPYE